MISYFIDRPVFAQVLVTITMPAGGLAITNLPAIQYPQVASLAVTVSVTYPGIDVQTVGDSVTQMIE